MKTVVEIENALQTLTVQDARKIADWLQNYLDDKWDDQIDRDIAAERLDKLADKAKHDYHAGQVAINKRRRPKMTRNLAEKRAVGRVGTAKFDGTSFLASLKK